MFLVSAMEVCVFPQITSPLWQLCLNVTENLGPLQCSEAAEKVIAYTAVVFLITVLIMKGKLYVRRKVLQSMELLLFPF